MSDAAVTKRSGGPAPDALDRPISSIAWGLGWALSWVGGIVGIIVTASTVSSTRLAGIADPGWVVTYGMPTVQIIGEIGVVAAIGGALFAAFFVPPQPDGVLDVGGFQAMRFATVGALVWTVAALLLVPLSFSYATSRSLSYALAPSHWGTVLDQVAESRSWLWTAGFALLATVLGRVVLRWGWAVFMLPLALLSLMPLALTGHSSTGGDHDLATNSLILHLVAATLWMGGLFAVVGYTFSGGRYAELAVRRFSRIAFWALIVVGVSGVINALVRMDWNQLFSETYGWLVFGKIMALIVLGGFGAVHRKQIIRRLSDGPVGRAIFVRFAAVELLVFGATFGLAVGLSRTPPPAEGSLPSITKVALGFDLPEPASVGRIFTDWRFDLIYGTAAIVLAIVYLRGVIRLRRRGDSWPIGRTVSWLAGCAVLLFVTSSGMGMYSAAMFSIHMIEHMVLSMLVPVLLVLGGPVTLALRALPVAGKDAPPGPREWINTALHSKFSHVITNPVLVVTLFIGSFYVLYLGGLFDDVVKYHSAHVLMNAHFLLSGYLFYWLVIGIDPAPRTLSPVAKVGIVFGSLPFHAFFGIALMMTDTVIAQSYYNSLHLPWYIDRMSDQRLGGGIAWAAGEIPLVLVMLALLVQWRRQDDRAAKRFDRREDRDDDAELASYNAMLRQMAGGTVAEPAAPADEAPVTQPHPADEATRETT
jgi:putative copper resistance protein D